MGYLLVSIHALAGDAVGIVLCQANPKKRENCIAAEAPDCPRSLSPGPVLANILAHPAKPVPGNEAL